MAIRVVTDVFNLHYLHLCLALQIKAMTFNISVFYKGIITIVYEIFELTRSDKTNVNIQI